MKQKLMSILLVLCMVVALVPAIAMTSAAANTSAGEVTDGTLPAGATIETGTATAFSGGDGTADNPYQIKDVTEFRYFQSQAKGDASYLALSYVLTGNIYFNEKLDYTNTETGLPNNVTLKGVNAYTQITGTFSGTFDGAGYGIYNSYARFANAGALFATVTGTIKNLNLYGGYVYFGNGAESGSLVQALNGGQLLNCYSSVGIYTKASATGGLVGKAISNPTIEDCTYAGAISAPDSNASNQLGGIVARAESAMTISGCANYAPISSQYSRIGGMVGLFIFKDATMTMTDCVNYGNLISTTSKQDGGIGGIVGLNYSNNYNGVVNYLRCANYGDITASATVNATGMAGDAGNTKSYRYCANYGDVSGKAASGLHGTANGSISFENCYSEGTFTCLADNQSSGLIAGWIKNGVTMKNCIGTGSIALFAGQSGTVTLDNNQKYDAGSLNIAEAVAILNTGLETPVWVAGKTAPELKWIADMNATPAPEIGIDGASLTIGRNVTLNLFIKAATVAEAGVTVKTISIVNNDGETVANGVLNEGTYVFTIEGLKAAEFGTNKVYKVQYTTEDAPETPVTCTESIEYSPLQYAINMYGKTDKAGLDEMLISLVNYADAAAKNTNASAAFKEKHADVDMTGVTAMETIVAKDTGKYTYDAKTMPGIGATLTNSIELNVVLNEIYTDVTVKVGDEIIEKNSNGAYAFYATDLYNEITFTFTGAEGTEPVTATTSLVQFLNTYVGTDYEAQATATAQYLYAARNFCLNNRTTND